MILSIISTIFEVAKFIIVAILQMTMVKDWFKGQSVTNDDIGFIYQRKRAQGQPKVLQGILNRASNSMSSYQGYQPNEIEDKIIRIFDKNDYVPIKLLS